MLIIGQNLKDGHMTYFFREMLNFLTVLFQL